MKVKFVPQNVEFEIKPGESVMHLAQDNGLYIKSVCKGVPSCAECRVRVVEGDHNVLPPASDELSLIGTGHFIDRRRLSCQLKCFGDITVDMNEQIAKENGLIVGRKKKLAVKDDRVEQAVRRSESTGDTDDTTESSDPTATPVEGEQPAREPREQRGGRDRGPRSGGGGDRGPRENRSGGENREPRTGGRPQGQGPAHAQGERPSNQQPSRPGENRPPQQSRPQGPRPEGEAQASGEPREGGAGSKRRRRRRGKGGGPGAGPGGGPSGGPSAGSNAPPSRPNTQPPKS